MKITDKIVTSKIQPTQTNVVWHNPETGELKMFGEKGWEIAGGSAGSSNDGDSNTNGYPIITVEGGTGVINLYAKANIFYDIKNTQDDTITIQQNIFDANSINGEMFIIEFDDIEGLEAIYPNYPEETIAAIKMEIMRTHSMGIISKQNDKYNLYIYTPEEPIEEPIEVDNLDITDLEVSMKGVVLTIKNIKFIEPNYNIGGQPVYLEEVESDDPKYKHKYKIVNNFMVMTIGLNVYYSNIPIEELTYVDIDHFMVPIIKDNFKSLYDKNVGEFVFNFNTPIKEIIFDNEIKWNEGNAPDVTQSGIMTISIVNGIGCYTFVNN